MPHTRRTILLTGFGPFPGVPHNVSGDLVRRVALAARQALPAYDVVARILPTEWHIAPTHVTDLIQELRPRLSLHFGVSNRAPGFVVETLARNAAGRMDAAGFGPDDDVLDPFGPTALPTGLPAGRIVARLHRMHLPAILSRDAGEYLCNAVFYASMRAQAALNPGARCGFIHLPTSISSTPNRGLLCLDRATLGGLEIIDAALGRSPATRRPAPRARGCPTPSDGMNSAS